MPNPTTPSTPSSNQPSATPQPAAKSAVPETKAIPAAEKPAESKAPVAEDSWDVHEDGKVVKKSRKEIIEAYQLRQLSDKKRSEAEKTMSEYNKLFGTLKGDPIKFLRAAGIDFDTLSTSYLAKKAEESMMDPKERELKQAKAEAEQYKKWVEEQKAKQTQAEQQKTIQAHKEKIHQEIIQAIEAHKDLGMPVNEELVLAIAQKMKLQDKKQKPLDAKDGVMKTYESTQKMLHGITTKMDGESLVKWLGPDIAKKIRQYDLAQLKAKRGTSQTPAPNSLVKPKEDSAPAKKPYTTWSEFKKQKLDTIQ